MEPEEILKSYSHTIDAWRVFRIQAEFVEGLVYGDRIFSVKAGQVLSLQEQSQLLRDLEACEVPRTCPHGRPTMIHVPVETLERQFGRRG